MIDSGAQSTTIVRSNFFDRKTIPRWWDQMGMIYYELSKPWETVNTECYQQQLTDFNRSPHEKRPEYRMRQHKVREILLALYSQIAKKMGKMYNKRWNIL